MERGLLTTKESSQKVHIDEEKLKYITSKVNIWDHFGISMSHYVSFDNDEELNIVKRFYMDLLTVYFKGGKFNFSCFDCVWPNDVKKQGCQKCGVNICTCFEFSEIKGLSSSELKVQNVFNLLQKKEKELIDFKNKKRFGIWVKDESISHPTQIYEMTFLTLLSIELPLAFFVKKLY